MGILLGLAETSGTTGSVMGELNTKLSAVAAVLAGRFITSLNGSGEGIRSFASLAVTALSGASAFIGTSAGDIIGSILSIGNCAPEAGAKSGSVAESIKAPFLALKTSAFSIMSNVGQGLINGLNSKKPFLVSAAKSMANITVNTMKSILRIASPSKVMRSIGEQTAQGFALGIDGMQSSIIRSAGVMAGSVTGYSYASGAGNAHAGDNLSSLTSRLDTLISMLSEGGEQVMQVDGRAFARLVREYS